MVVNALNQLSMKSISHVVNDNKELAREIRRLARLDAHLVDSNEGGVIVHNDLK